MVYLSFIPIILNWTFHNFVKKGLVKYINNFQLLLLIHITYHVMFISYIKYLFYINSSETVNFLTGMRKVPLILYLKIIGLMFISILGSYCYFYLIKTKNVNYVVPIIRGGSQVLILLIGYYLYNENITKYTIIGIMMILSGIYLI